MTSCSTVLAAAGADVDAVWAEVDTGRPLATVEKEHTAYVESHDVWGVPTFIVDDAAVFVRLLELPGGDGELATAYHRAHPRPGRVADPQRVQAHLHPPLTAPFLVRILVARATRIRTKIVPIRDRSGRHARIAG